MRRTALLALVLSPALLPAQTPASFSAYGSGCGGSSPACISVNWNAQFSGNIGVTAYFGLINPGPATAQVACGLELYCATTSGAPVQIYAAIWDKDATTGNPGKELAKTTITVGGTPAGYRGQFAGPLVLTANTEFFVVFDNKGLKLPIAARGTGTTVSHWHSGPNNWRGPYASAPWMYRVLCCGAANPSLSTTGLPKLGQSFSIDLSQAPASASGFLSVGVGRTNIDLSIAGAAGCALLCNPSILVPITTDAAGAFAQKVAVPNDTKLMGAKANTQYAVMDAQANSLGLAFSNGGELTAGT